MSTKISTLLALLVDQEIVLEQVVSPKGMEQTVGVAEIVPDGAGVGVGVGVQVGVGVGVGVLVGVGVGVSVGGGGGGGVGVGVAGAGPQQLPLEAADVKAH